MPKTPKPHSQKKTGPLHFHSQHPWKCEHHSGRSEILAFAQKSGNWESIAVIQPGSGVSPRRLAEFIAGLVNDCQLNGPLLDHAREALEMLLRAGLNFSTEQDAEAIIARIKKLRPPQDMPPDAT
jgi:hypothetical protein